MSAVPYGLDPVSGEPYTVSRIPAAGPLHERRLLTESQRAVYRQRAAESRQARQRADLGLVESLHPVNTPQLDPSVLMPQLPGNHLAALSLFSGCGGLDLGFDRAGFEHVGSWELMQTAADTLRINRPRWTVHGGESGDVRHVDWNDYRGTDVVHGGPPCQPFSNAGRQRGADDPRDMWPEFVRAIRTIQPRAFVAENVTSLISTRFSDYVNQTIMEPLSKLYFVRCIKLQAYEFGVPQRRQRVFFIGFKDDGDAASWIPPVPRFARPTDTGSHLPRTMGVRAALGLPNIGYDDVAPTLRSSLSGARHTTSILSSTSAAQTFAQLELWPNGVAATREAASRFPAKNHHFRLSVPDIALIQGFTDTWKFAGAVYHQLGQIGNSVAPPVAYSVAESIALTLAK